MLADFTGRFNVFDIDYKMQLEQLAKEIDIMFKGASRGVYQADDTDAADWYGTYLSPFLGLCLKITSVDATNQEVLVFSGTWASNFNTHVEAVVTEILDGMFDTAG
jgi:hypothetical protein